MEKARILIVEDDGIIAMHIRRSLVALGYTVIDVVLSGEEAIQKVAETSPDLILMDIRLEGGMDGIETSEHIRGVIDVPVVYLTAYSEEVTLQRAKETGPYGYVLKPFNSKDLSIAIEMALHKVKLEKEIREKERWLAITLESVADAVITTDANGIVMLMNPVAQMITGWKDEEAMGRHLEEIMYLLTEESHLPVDLMASITLQTRGANHQPQPTLLIARDGREISIEESVTPIKDERGEVSGIVITFRDITERIQAEESLRLTQFSVDQAGDAAFWMGPDARIIYVNDAACRSLGYSREELLTKKVHDFDPDFTEETWPEHWKDLQKRGSFTVESHHRTKDGRIFPVEVIVNYLNFKGREYNCAFARDISKRKHAERAMKRQLEELKALYSVANAGTLVAGEDKLIERTTEILGATLYPDNVGVLLLDPEAGVLRAHSSYKSSKKVDEITTIKLGSGITGKAVMEGKPIRVVDVNLEPEYIGIDLGMRSELCVPLKVGEQVIGVINAESRKVGAFTDDDERLMVTLAGQLATAIEKARLFAASQRQALELSSLYEAALATSSELDIKLLLKRLYRQVQRLLQPDTFLVALYDDQLEEIRVALAMEEGEALSEWAGLRLPMEKGGLSGWVIRNRRPLLISDMESETLPVEPRHGTRPSRAWLGVPLIAQDRVIGAISVQSFQPYAFDKGHRRFMVSLAAHTAISIENARLHDETSRQLKELSALTEVSSALRDAATIDEMLPILLHEAARVIGADYGIIFLSEPGTEALVARCWYPPKPGLVGLRHPAGEGITGYVADTGEIYFTEKLAQDPKHRFLPGEEEFLSAVKSNISLPLRTRERTVGVMHICIIEKRPFTDEEVSLLTAIAGIAANAIHRTMLREQTELSLQRLAALRTIDQTITNSLDLSVTFNVLLDQLIGQLGVDAASILLIDPHLQTLEYSAGRGFRSQAVTRTSIRFGSGHAGRAAIRREIVSIPDLSTQPDSPIRTRLLVGESFQSYYAAPLIAKGQVRGVLEVFHREQLPSDADWVQFLETLAGQAAIAIDNISLFNDLQRSNLELTVAYDATIEGWSHALELHDLETQGHSHRVTELAMQLARVIGVNETELTHIRRGALLHDIGKMGISDSILNKPGSLTEEEWRVVHKHPTNAYELLSIIPFLEPALDIPHYHHEKWDGTGYPRGLKGEEIPIAARVFAIVDVWDALLSDRPYRKAWTKEKTLNYLRAQSGKQFDPDVVKAFMEILCLS